MQVIFTPDDSGTTQARGYATVEYSSDNEDETVVETTEGDLASIFEDAESSGLTLDGADEPMEAAVDEPLRFLDYLALEDGEIVFNEAHSRPQDSE